LFNVADDIVSLILTASGGQPRAVGVRGMKRPISAADVTLGGGALALTDVWWHLCCDDLAVSPAVNDCLVEPSGTHWQVLTPPQMQTCHSRWKCACRQL
jgi:hypothetical protein